jgi:mRNA deadenylase 3'-5' endonuclease subunit Ccr4
MKTILSHLASKDCVDLFEKYEIKGLILTGDLNADPDEDVLTQIYAYKENGVDFESVFNYEGHSNKIKLHENTRPNIRFTTYKQRKVKFLMRIIDYIFFDSKSITLLKANDLPNESDFNDNNVGLPSPIYPSDHLHLIAHFSIKY